jgi:hypothetical protein
MEVFAMARLKPTEDMLRCLGVQHNQDGTELVPVREDAPPDEGWGLDQIADYVKRLIQMARDNADLVKRSLRWRTVLKFRLGRALSLARARAQAEGLEWGHVCEQMGCKRSTAWRWSQAYDKATTKWADNAEMVVGKYTWRELKQELRIGRDKPDEPQPHGGGRGRGRGGSPSPPAKPAPEPGDPEEQDKERQLLTLLGQLQEIAHTITAGGFLWTATLRAEFREAVQMILDRIPT